MENEQVTERYGSSWRLWKRNAPSWRQKVTLMARLLPMGARTEYIKSEDGVLGASGGVILAVSRSNELQTALDQERAASEGKDKRLREALIQAEAARRASVAAMDRQKKFEDMQSVYKVRTVNSCDSGMQRKHSACKVMQRRMQELLAKYAPGLAARGVPGEEHQKKRRPTGCACSAKNRFPPSSLYAMFTL